MASFKKRSCLQKENTPQQFQENCSAALSVQVKKFNEIKTKETRKALTDLNKIHSFSKFDAGGSITKIKIQPKKCLIEHTIVCNDDKNSLQQKQQKKQLEETGSSSKFIKKSSSSKLNTNGFTKLDSKKSDKKLTLQTGNEENTEGKQRRTLKGIRRSTSIKKKLENVDDDSDVYEDAVEDQKEQSLINEIQKNDYLIYLHTKIKEKYRYVLPTDYKVDIDERRKILEWLLTIQQHYKLDEGIYIMAVSIFDYIAFCKKLQATKYSLLGIIAMFIAAKHENVYATDTINLEICAKKIFKQKYKICELKSMELKILNYINFDLIIPIPLVFLNEYHKYLSLNKKQEILLLTEFILEMFTLDCTYSHYSPSLLASSALYLAAETTDSRNMPQVLNLLEFFHNIKNIKKMASYMYSLITKKDWLPNKVFSKYSPKKKCIAKLII